MQYDFTVLKIIKYFEKYTTKKIISKYELSRKIYHPSMYVFNQSFESTIPLQFTNRRYRCPLTFLYTLVF